MIRLNFDSAIARTQTLHGVTRDASGNWQPIAEAVKQALAELRDAKVDKAAALELIKAAHAGDKEARQELCELRVNTINNFIFPSLNFGSSFFEVVNLGPADRPVFQNETKMQVSIGYIGDDGDTVRRKLVNPQTEELIPLNHLSTEEVTYRLQDIYNGDISGAAKRNVDVAFDMANKMDQLAYDLFTASLVNGGVFGTFTVTGTKQNRVYVPNTRINTSNLPTTNIITLAGNGAATLLRLAVVRAVLKYCGQWANAWPDGPLAPTGRIIVPSLDYSDLAEEITPTGSTSNAVADALLGNYASFDYLGIRWQLIPDNTLAPGTCFPQLNKPVGTIFTKSSMDEVFEEVNRKKNEGAMSMRKVVGFYIPAQNRPRALKVIYRS